MIPRFKKSRFEPKPIETDYWIDLNENEYGGVFKYYDNNAMVWKQTESITREREPLFTNSAAYTITTNDIDYWNSKVGIEDFDALKEEVLSLGSNEEYVTMETLKYYMDVIQGELGNIDLTVLDKINDKADKSTTLAGYGIKDAYTKKEVDDKFTEWKVELPLNVSYFKNDAGYVTESNLESKLPDHIVSDADYVHTDNNFTDSYKNKLDNISEDLKAVAYDDTELRLLISGIDTKVDSLSTKVNQDITSTVNTLTEQIQTKANVDDVYTKAYLDEIHSQFVRKTHNTYGFIDDRPLSLEVTDTGHVFYDYTVNEALIWVADEWRILRSNEALENFILDEDIDETGIGMWEFEELTDARFCRLKKYIGEYTSTMDLVVPNLYIKYFTLEINEDKVSDLIWGYRKTKISALNTFTSLLGESDSHSFIIITPVDELAIVYPEQEQHEGFLNTEIYDIFGNHVGKPVEQGAVKLFPYVPITTAETVSVNSFKISQGVRKINQYSFCNVKAATNNDLIIPSGTESIGHMAFYNSSITSVEFPRNPVKLGVYCFGSNPITKITFPKTLDWGHIMQGGGAYAFANNSGSGVEVILKEGVKAIPQYCFFNTPVTNIVFPDSLELIGMGAFYNSGITGDFKTNNLKTLQNWAFRNHKFDTIWFDDQISYISPYAFYTYVESGHHPCTSINVPVNVEIMYPGSFPAYLGNCGIPLVIPPKLKNIPSQFVYGYGAQINNPDTGSQKLEIPIVLSEGLEAIEFWGLYRALTTGELVLPESLKYIASGAFGQMLFMTNTTFKIPKNVKVIGGQNSTRGANLQGRNDIITSTDISKYWPTSKNGYSLMQYYKYLEDGGKVSEYGEYTFYWFGLNTLKAFEVDEENQYFKAIDGVLFSKDGKRLVGYPPAKAVSVYEVPEGCVYFDSKVFASSGYKWTYTYTDESGTEVTFYPGYKNGTTNLKNKTYSGENPLREVVLPSTIINYTPEEMRELFPTAWVGDIANMLTASSWYFCGIEKFTVSDDHPRYKNVDYWLLSKDGTTLETIPGGLKGTHRLPDTVTTIKPGAFYCSTSSGCNSEREAAQIASSATYANYPGAKYDGLNIIIPPSVVNITDLTLYSLNNLNRLTHSSVTFEAGNPAFTYNSSTGNYERI